MLLAYYTYLGHSSIDFGQSTPTASLVFKDDKDLFFAIPASIFFFLLLRYWHWTLICHLWGRGEYCKYFHWVLLWEGRDFTWTCSKAPPSYHLRSTRSAITVHCHWCLVTISLFLYVLYFSCICHSLITLQHIAPATVFYYTTLLIFIFENTKM